jgi:hypothetical protein
MDYEDITRIMNQLHSDDTELFEKWLDEHYCNMCPFHNKFINGE